MNREGASRERIRNVAFLVPAFNAGRLLAAVLEELRGELEKNGLTGARIFVVDDGSTDDTVQALPDFVRLLRHEQNRGKGAALRTGFEAARAEGFSAVVTLDADLQHPAHEAVRLFLSVEPLSALLLAVRDLEKAGAPKPNRLSNRFSNWVLSMMAGAPLLDTQCGLRRYPLTTTFTLSSHETGYSFEADVLLRAARSGISIVHLPCEVRYPKGSERVSHFDSVRDPARIVRAVVHTALFYRPGRGTETDEAAES